MKPELLKRLADAVEEVINHTDGPWHERREEIVTGMEEHGCTGHFNELLSWFGGDIDESLDSDGEDE